MYTKKDPQLQNIWDVAGAPFSPDDIDMEKAYRKVMSHVKPRKWYQSPLIVCWQRIAAIVILPLMVVVVCLLPSVSDRQSDTAGRQPVYLEVSTPFGTHTKMNLPDGSCVWLNAGSLLKYPSVFTSGSRRVYLSGEAYFEVESNKENPFVVETKNVHLQATGTAFNVEAYRKDSLITVTMVRGEVAVQIENASSIPMKPGERMEYDLKNDRYEIHNTDAYKWYAWKDGLMVFRNDPLEYVFKKIGQTFNVDITVKDASIGKHPYRATFEKESLDEILRLLSLTAPIRYKYFDREKDADDHYMQQRIEVYKY
jgi:ferric-dicitrate binding protein FerR (iron transport regulator)